MRTKSQQGSSYKSSSGAPSEAGDLASSPTRAAAAPAPSAASAATSPTPAAVKKSDRLAQKRLLGGPLTGLAAAVAALARPPKRARISAAAAPNEDPTGASGSSNSTKTSTRRGRPPNADKQAGKVGRRSVGRPPTKALQVPIKSMRKSATSSASTLQKTDKNQQRPAPLLPLAAAAQRRSLDASKNVVVRLRRLSSNDAEVLAAAAAARDAVSLPGRRSNDTLDCNKQLKRLVSSLRDVCPAAYRACSLIDPSEVNDEAEAKVVGLACLGLVPSEAGQAIRESIQSQALRLQLHRATSSRQPMRLCRHVHKRQPDPNILVLHNGKYISKEEVRQQKQAAQAAASLEQQRKHHRRLATGGVPAGKLSKQNATSIGRRRQGSHHRHRLWPLCRQANLRWSSQPTFSLHPNSAKFVKDADVASDSLDGVLSEEDVDEDEDDEEMMMLEEESGLPDDGEESEGVTSCSVDPTESRAKSTASSGSQGFEVTGLTQTDSTVEQQQQPQKKQQQQQPRQKQQLQRRIKQRTNRSQTGTGDDQKLKKRGSNLGVNSLVRGGIRRSKRRVDLRSKLLQWNMFSEERKQKQQQQQQQLLQQQESEAKPKFSIMDSDKKRQGPSSASISQQKRQQKNQLATSPLSLPAGASATNVKQDPSLASAFHDAVDETAVKPDYGDDAANVDSSTVPKSSSGVSGSARPERKQIFGVGGAGADASSSAVAPAFPLSHSLTRELQALTNDLSCDVEIQRSMPFDKFIVNVVDLSLGDLETLQERLDDSSFKLRAVKHKLVNSTGLVFCAVLVQRKSNVIRSIRRMLDSADNWESSSSNGSDAEEDNEDKTAIAGLSSASSAAAAASSSSVGQFTSEEVKAAVSFVRIEKSATAAEASSTNEMETESEAAVSSLQQQQQKQEQQQPQPVPQLPRQPPPPPQPRQPTASELLKLQQRQKHQKPHSPSILPNQQRVQLHSGGTGQTMVPVGILSNQPQPQQQGSNYPQVSGPTSLPMPKHTQVRPAYPGIVLRHPSGASLIPNPYHRPPYQPQHRLIRPFSTPPAAAAAATAAVQPPSATSATSPSLTVDSPVAAVNNAATTTVPVSTIPTSSSTAIRMPTTNRVFNVHVSASNQIEQSQQRQGPKRKSMIVLPEGDTLFIEGNHPNLESVINRVLESRPAFRQTKSEASVSTVAAMATATQHSTGQPSQPKMVQQFPKTAAIIKNSFKTMQQQQQQLLLQQQQQQNPAPSVSTTPSPAISAMTYTVTSTGRLVSPVVRQTDKISSVFDSPPSTTAAATAAASAQPFRVSFKEYMNVKLKMERQRNLELEQTRGRLIDHLGRTGAAGAAAGTSTTASVESVDAPASSVGSSVSATTTPSGKRILFPYSVSVPKWATRGQQQQEQQQQSSDSTAALLTASPPTQSLPGSIVVTPVASSTTTSTVSVVRSVIPTVSAASASTTSAPVLVLAAAQRTTDLQRQAALFPMSLLKKSTILQMPHGVLSTSPATTVSVTVSPTAAPATTISSSGSSNSSPSTVTTMANSANQSSPSKIQPATKN